MTVFYRTYLYLFEFIEYLLLFSHVLDTDLYIPEVGGVEGHSKLDYCETSTSDLLHS